MSCFLFLGVFVTYILIGLNGLFSFLKLLKEDDIDNFILDLIDDNLNNKLINSISFRQFCIDDEEKLNLGIWDGTIDGCDCEGNIFKGKCSPEKIENGCKHLFANDPINYSIFNSMSICVKRTKLNYGEYLKSNQVISNKKECTNTYNKYCGIIDTLGRKLCIKEEEDCPITINDIKNKNNFNLFENEVNSKADEMLLASIKLFQYLPCVYPLEKFWNYYYVLEPSDQRCIFEINGKKYDERYEKLFNFSTDKLQLYNDNSITKKLKLTEEELNKMKNDEIYLFGINFFGFDTQVVENYDHDILISNQNKSNTLIIYIEGVFSAIALGTHIVYWILSCIDEFNVKVEKCCFSTECKLKIKTLKKNVSYIAAVPFFTSYIFYFIINIYIYKYNKKMKSILDVKGDEIVNELVKLIDNDISTNYNCSLANVIVIPFIFVFFIIVMYLYGKSSPEKEKENEEYLHKDDDGDD